MPILDEAKSTTQKPSPFTFPTSNAPSTSGKPSGFSFGAPSTKPKGKLLLNRRDIFKEI